jgi:hypothetical protein
MTPPSSAPPDKPSDLLAPGAAPALRWRHPPASAEPAPGGAGLRVRTSPSTVRRGARRAL